MRMRKQMRRGAATVEQAIDAMAPGVAEQLAGKAKAEIGTGEQRLGALTGHPDIATAGRKLEAEGRSSRSWAMSRQQRRMLPSRSRPLASESRKS
jgi:hypothetical protein